MERLKCYHIKRQLELIGGLNYSLILSNNLALKNTHSSLEERRRPTDSSIPRIYCEFCSANVTYIYVSHANKLHYDIISKVWIGCDDCDQFFPNQVEMTAKFAFYSTEKRKKIFLSCLILIWQSFWLLNHTSSIWYYLGKKTTTLSFFIIKISKYVWQNALQKFLKSHSLMLTAESWGWKKKVWDDFFSSIYRIVSTATNGANIRRKKKMALSLSRNRPESRNLSLVNFVHNHSARPRSFMHMQQETTWSRCPNCGNSVRWSTRKKSDFGFV